MMKWLYLFKAIDGGNKPSCQLELTKLSIVNLRRACAFNNYAFLTTSNDSLFLCP